MFPTKLSPITQVAVGLGTGPSWRTHGLSARARGPIKSDQQGYRVSFPALCPRNLMVFRKLLARLNNSRKGDTESTGPVVPPRPQSQLGIGSSTTTPQTLQRRKSDGEQSRFGFDPSLQVDLGATGGATLEVPSVSAHPLPIPKVGGSEPVKLSSHTVDPTAAYENKPDWKGTLGASARLAIDVLTESSDVFTPLKTVAACLSVILKHYDVRYDPFAKRLAPLTLGPASGGEP